MTRLNWLPEVLSGVVPLDFCPGYKTRGKENIKVDGVVFHHTATGPNWSDQRVRELLRDGRTDLAGPLSQVGVRRDGTWDIIALGRANHNGYGEWGNNSLGLEVYNDGKGEPFTNSQLVNVAKGSAAVLVYLNLPVSHLKGHKETDPHRKIDPYKIDMDEFRAMVSTYMEPQIPTPIPPIPTTINEDTMTFIWTPRPDGMIVLLHAGKLVWIDKPEGIDFEGSNQWFLQKDPVTWDRVVMAYGPIIGLKA